MGSLTIIQIPLFFVLALGLDPQPQKNVWQTPTNSRPWKTPEWQTASTGSHQDARLSSSSPPPVSPLKGSSVAFPTWNSTRTLTNEDNTRRSTFDHKHNSNRNRQPSFQAVALNNSKVTDEELRTLSEELFDDVSDIGIITINYQAQTRSNSLNDVAPKPLLAVQANVLRTPTIESMMQLFDNYIADSSFVESVTAAERNEESTFLDKVLDTAVLKRAMEFLADKGYVPKNSKSYKELLNIIWFTMYSRGGGIIGSSAFEHVFLGELKKDEVSGLHNWVFFAHEEGNQQADYMGYLRKLELGRHTNLIKIHYRWRNTIKPTGTMFVGTSPELEMALYTVCFLTRPNERCPLNYGGKSFGIQTYTYRHRGKTVIGSAYPTF